MQLHLRPDCAEGNDEKDDDRDFSWSDDAADVIVPHQDAIAVYINPRNRIVIRQEGGARRESGLCADDPWIEVNPKHAERLARAILDAADECRALSAEQHVDHTQPASAERAPPIAPQAPKHDHTAAARQRRYRQRKGKRAPLFEKETITA